MTGAVSCGAMNLCTVLQIVSLALTSTVTEPASSGTAKDWVGPLVLNVNGKEVTLKIFSSSCDADEEGGAPSFLMDSTTFMLEGEVDLNGDGKADERDKPKVDADGNIVLASLVNKTVLLTPTDLEEEGIDNHVDLPGLGRCAVLKGSTLTITKFKKTGGVVDRWSGTVSLKLKPQKKGAGALQVQGRFECGVSQD